MAIHSSIRAWRIPWTEELGRLQSMESQRVGHNWSDLACTHSFQYKLRHQAAKLLVVITGNTFEFETKFCNWSINSISYVSALAGGFFNTSTTWEVLLLLSRFSRVRLCATP